MSKLIKLDGVAKEIVVKSCVSCPFNHDGFACNLFQSFNDKSNLEPPLVMSCTLGKIPKDCQLPDYVDENEHTAPDGTVLVAVDDTGKTTVCKCCYYLINQKCTKGDNIPACFQNGRKDRRSIVYVPKNNQEVK